MLIPRFSPLHRSHAHTGSAFANAPAAAFEPLEPRVLLAAQTIGVDWATTVATTTHETFGVNVWKGNDPAVSSQQTYQNNLAQITPGLTRIHSGQQSDDSSTERGWVDYATQSWDASKIDQVIDSLETTSDELMLNISLWPDWMDANNDGRLDANQYDDFAQWTADLVQIINIDNGHDVKYWEVTNELDLKGGGYYINNPGEWASIYNQAQAAMRAVDPSIKVGGVAYANPWRPTMGQLITQTAPNLDFFTYHIYENGSASTPDADVYDGARDMGETVRYVRGILDQNGAAGAPIGLTEYNISWTFDTFDVRMTNNKGAVFDALVMKYAAEANIWTLQAWNEEDGVYGKIDPSTPNLRLPGQFQALAHDHLIGEVATITNATNTQQVDAFAVAGEDAKTVLLINRSGGTHTVDLNFANGWSPDGSTVEIHRIEDTGYSTTSTSYNAATNNFTIDAHSVVVLSFDDATPPVNLIEAVADAHAVQSNANANFGSATTAVTYNAGQDQHAFIKFDLAGLSGFSEAKLRLHVDFQAATSDLRVRAVDNTSWSETGLTWNNRPNAGDELGVIQITEGDLRRYELDLTSHVQQLLAAGETQMSLRVENVSWGFGSGLIQTRESAYPGPQLVVDAPSSGGAGTGVAKAVADAWVDQQNQSVNNGTGSTLELYNAHLTDHRGFVKFDLGGISAGQPVTLRLHAGVAGGSDAIRVRGLTNNGWSETGITWNNAPSSSNTLGTLALNASTRSWVELDVTTFVQQQITAGETQVSFQLDSDDWGYQTIEIDSRESGALAPELAYTTTGGGSLTGPRAAIADAWIDQQNQSANNGTGSTLELYNAHQNDHRAYLKFDLTGITSGQSVVLRLHASVSGGSGSDAINVRGVTDNNWTQTGINWNNQPGGGSTLGTIAVTSSTKTWVELDVTAFVQQQLAAGQTEATFRLDSDVWGYETISIDSLESGITGPQLVVS
ncbi:MAG: DNRLRE domain-containing protein [Planctomycetota bacterium]